MNFSNWSCPKISDFSKGRIWLSFCPINFSGWVSGTQIHHSINLGLHEERDLVRNAINTVLNDGKVRTRDIGGYASTKQFTQAVINCI